jgi:hypothetical protein
MHLLPGYMLLSLISSFVFRAVRDALPHNLIAQEKIVKATLIALAIADVSLLKIRYDTMKLMVPNDR